MGKTINIKNSFNDVVRINPDQLGYFAVWDAGHHINFWNRNGDDCIGDLRFTPDTFDSEAELVFLTLKAHGMDFIRVGNSQDPRRPEDAAYRFYFRPDAIEYFEDDIDKDHNNGLRPLTIAGVPFYLSEEEKADFKHQLKSRTPDADWLEFGGDLQSQFTSSSGHYAFRKSLVTDMFAVPEKGHIAIQTPDKYRSFVPVRDPAGMIDDIARVLPQLVKSDAPATAYPLYYNPAVYPADRRHHINIIMRR